MIVSVLAAFGAVGAKLVMLHVFEREASLSAVEKQRNIIESIKARRGNITDTRGNLLAATRPIIDLGVDPNIANLEGENRDKIFEIAAILNIPAELLLEKCRKGTRPLVNSLGITEHRPVQWRKIAEIDEPTYEKIRAIKFRGIKGDKRFERTYPLSGLAAHVIGYLNREGIAGMGVENTFNYYLEGQDGWIQSEKDARKREMAHFRTREVPAHDGMNVELSIDIIVQEMVQRELEKIVEEQNPDSACIIVGDPVTGFIYALASYPSFDPNAYNKYPIENLKNRAITDVLEPGSTFKIVPIAAALNENMVTQDDTFDCGNANADFKGKILRLPKDTHDYGMLSVRQIAEKSSNRGAAHLGMLLGERKVYDYSKLFGFGEKTGFGLGAESNGILRDPKYWDGLTITRLPMGHAVSATPMQIHCAMNVIANGGIYMQPQVVKRVYTPDGASEISFEPKQLRRVISQKTASTMCDILTGVVGKNGTAQRAAVDGFKVAGKTGTTQKLVDGKYSNKDHVASFSGFFPSERPRLTITIVVDSPKGGRIGYGGTIAAPAFAHIAKQAAQYMGIQSNEEFERILAFE